MICGRWTEMSEDDHGLHVKGTCILDVEEGRKAYALMKAGVLDGMSIGFNITEGGRSEKGRVIEEVDLWEVSLVTWGANPDALITSVKARKSIRDFEAFLRESGFSRAEAVAIAASGFKALDDQREAEAKSEVAERLNNLIQLMRTQ
jgi:phage head maturation protease